MTTLNTSIEIIDVTARDGLQNEAVEVSTQDKIQLVKRAVAAGARRVEAVSFVSPKAVPRMADADAVMSGLRSSVDFDAQGVSLIGLVVNQRGAQRAIEAGIDEVNFIVVSTETFNQRNQGRSVAASLEELAVCVALVREAGLRISMTLGAAFGCPFEGEVSESRLCDILHSVKKLGVDEIALADTIGVADPIAVERRIAILRELAPSAKVRLHFHNTRNTGIANAYSAWRAGADSLDASIGGIGGCPFAPAATGNIPSEDTVYMFERMGIETGYQLDSLVDSARWVGELLGRPVPGLLSRSGSFPNPRADSICT